MEYRRFDRDYYIRLDKGDELLSSVAEVCARERIAVASLTGIGGCSSATVGVFDCDKKAYDRERVEGLLEMVSLTGNVTTYEGKPYVHAHASFAYHGDDGIGTLSGHLLEAMIELTGELVLTPEAGRIGRRYIEELGIRIWDFDATK